MMPPLPLVGRLLGATQHQPSLTWCTHGGGPRAARFSKHSKADSLMPQVPSDPTVEWGNTPSGSLYKVYHSLSAYRQPSHVLVCRIEAIVNNHADEALP
jgi:hypothetical protein